MIDSKYLFITGMLRSGTTLLEKIINNYHSSTHIHYQPCMELFVNVKNSFLTSLNYPPETYPLSPLFCENRYTRKSFDNFLNEYSPKIWPILPERLSLNNNNNNQKLADILACYWSSLAQNVKYDLLGAKEVLCEEYTPYLASNGYKIIFIIRDPRDVIASMNYGEGAKHVGAIRPTLYNLRIWRKSVAFAIHLAKIKKAIFVRYEDLVQNPANYIEKIFLWLGETKLNADQRFETKLKGIHGIDWQGNSSFGKINEISSKSVGRYKKILPEKTIDYIEAICHPEIKLLNYKIDLKEEGHYKKIISDFSEPYNIEHKKIKKCYSTNYFNIKNELQRLKLIYHDDIKTNKQINDSSYFIFKSLKNDLTASVFC